MAGSIKWFNYTSDAGVGYAIQNDESKGEAVAAPGGVMLTVVNPSAPTAPRRLQYRYVNAFDINFPARRARFKVGSVTTFNAITGATIITEAAGDGTAATTWRVTSKRGEQSALPYIGDSGLLDGDQ
jgi:hypothetical protein